REAVAHQKDSATACARSACSFAAFSLRHRAPLSSFASSAEVAEGPVAHRTALRRPKGPVAHDAKSSASSWQDLLVGPGGAPLPPGSRLCVSKPAGAAPRPAYANASRSALQLDKVGGV